MTLHSISCIRQWTLSIESSEQVVLVLKNNPLKLSLRKRRIHSGNVVCLVQITPKVCWELCFTYERSAWYYSIPVGCNKLAQMVPEICKLENILGHKMNHSLRATGAIELYEAEMSEKNHPRENWSPFTRIFMYVWTYKWQAATSYFQYPIF